ncbi:HNH endonuclease signature motif containing protein [Fischerella sp. JS2]|uniref:HNH endonuclease signature motif containing protein n=1 Tax=Fischerella sp. JS2 TaxID=2597771 RepID=UPI0028EC655C|nr:HNH endonuclease signature motif containing protein [Fischerella sp. JS2]
MSQRLCEFCSIPLIRREEEKTRDFAKRRFCNKSCSTRYTNIKHPKPKLGRQINCLGCNTIVHLKPYKGGGYIRRKYCDACLKKAKGKIAIGNQRKPDFLQRTKAEVFSKSASWQAARSKVQRSASKLFHQKYPQASCQICGYDKHIEVCHIEPVSSFPQDALISEINALSNLVGLCPNHHWEFDNGLLILPLEKPHSAP